MCEICIQVDSLFEEINKDPYKFISEGGYRGVRRNSKSCPLGRAFCDKLDYEVLVDHETLTVYDSKNPLFYQVPDNIAKFIKDFDEGRYPELESNYV